MHSALTLGVRADLDQAPARLRATLTDITQATPVDLRWSPSEQEHAAMPQAATPAPSVHWDGHLDQVNDQEFTIVHSGLVEALKVPRTQHTELSALLGLRDAATAVLSTEAESTQDTEELGDLRQVLRDRYEAYVQAFGPVNRYSLSATGRIDPDTGQPRMSRRRPQVMATFRQDPFAPLVMALETFDETTQTATPAAIVRERVVYPRVPVRGCEDPSDALAVCMDQMGRVDLEVIADLLGVEEREARERLGDLVFTDPVDGRLVHRAEYCSGNVVAKHEAAVAAAATDPQWKVNVDALAAVIPEPVGMDDIEPRLGAAWIDAPTHQEFLAEILEDPNITVEHPGPGMWQVSGGRWGVKATSEWGTQRAPASVIAQAAMEQRVLRITDEAENGARVLNPVETEQAHEKQRQLQERFAEWVWEEPRRATRLVGQYNRQFNSIALRDYAVAGDHLTLPGLVATFTPRAHQRAAVARMLAEPAVGLFHQVGAGKTAEMVMGVMELRRLGMARKPAVVVPNHMLEQFSREWLQLYPAARVLTASSEDLTRDRRRAFVARIATNDWDAVVMTRTAFERLPVGGEFATAYAAEQVQSLRAMAEQCTEKRTVKRVEKMVAQAEEALRKRMDAPRDPGISFEESGIDYLVVDEIHDFKNLRTLSNIPDAAIVGSKRATDLHLKTEYLRSRHGQRVITGATATPIANSISEAHVMMRYLRPDLLAEANVQDFDAWAATFGQTVTEMELAPAGGYRLATRFARFTNVPEMLRIWHTMGDIKTAADLHLPTPELVAREDGQRVPRVVTVPASTALRAYVTELGLRADAVKSRSVDPREDNMLKISTDGRQAALDLRMVGVDPQDDGLFAEPTKLAVAAQTIASIWREHRDDIYTDPVTGQESATSGALQLVFCDLGTPSSKWNAYDELRDLLTEQGLDRSRVRFIHEAATDTAKATLFAAARSGQIDVLIGSTAKMGVGTNIQARAIALHHLDCPWRPADVEQREGRLLRQGNQNPQVHVLRYVSEGSFDAYMWQTVQRKATFIGQLMRGGLEQRSIEDIGSDALSYAEVKALASGNPLLLEKAQADAEVARLSRLHRAWERNRFALRSTVATSSELVARVEQELPAVRAGIARTVSTRAEAFTMSIDAVAYPERATAAAALATWVREHTRGVSWWQNSTPLGPVGVLGGHTIEATQILRQGRPAIGFHLRDVPHSGVVVSRDSFVDIERSGLGPVLGAVRQIENRITSLPTVAEQLTTQRATAQREGQVARQGLNKPFKHAEALNQAREHAAQITAELTGVSISDTEVPEHTPVPAGSTSEAVSLAQMSFGASAQAATGPVTSPAPRMPRRSGPSSTPEVGK
jgi:N12 class adenine-specific DNA methylase